MVRIAVLDDYQHAARDAAAWDRLPAGAQVQFFHDTIKDHAALVARLRPFHVLVTTRERTALPAPVLEALPELRLIAGSGRSQNNVDMPAATRLGILVCGTDSMGSPTAELTWALILALARHVPAEDRAMRQGRWQTTVGMGLEGKTLGLMGLGRIGSHVAAVGRVFGMQVIAWSPTLTPERAQQQGAAMVSREELFRRADVLSIHLRLSDLTRGLVTAADLARMKPTAYLVNTSRGPIVDQAALLAALRERRIAGAGLDVFDEEPLPPDHPLLALENTVLTPHLGYVTRENYRVFFGTSLDNILAYLAGTPQNMLNPQAWERQQQSARALRA